MKSLHIKACAVSPEIKMDLESCHFSIKGISRPEHSVIFYSPLISWWNEMIEELKNQRAINKDLEIEIFFTYINSVSIKLMFDVFRKMDEANKYNKKMKIVWYYHNGDLEMKETGEEYKKLLQIPFEVVAESSK